MTNILTKHKHIIFLCVGVAIFISLLVFLPEVLSGHYVSGKEAALVTLATSTTPVAPTFTPSYVAAPASIRAIYMTSWVAGTPSLRTPLVNLIDTTELNAVVIDIKDYSGNIVFNIDDNPALKAYGSESVRVPDMQAFIQSLHEKGIYVIGRIAVFQDAYFVKYRPDLAVKNAAGTEVWKDKKGISWIDPGSEEYWAYIVL